MPETDALRAWLAEARELAENADASVTSDEIALLVAVAEAAERLCQATATFYGKTGSDQDTYPAIVGAEENMEHAVAALRAHVERADGS